MCSLPVPQPPWSEKTCVYLLYSLFRSARLLGASEDVWKEDVAK